MPDPMIDAQRQQQWQAILSLSEQLHALAEAEEWDALLTLYPQRDELLQAFFAQPVAEHEAAFLREAIPALQAQDQALMARCAASRDEAAQQLGRLSQGRKAEAAYHQFR